MHLHPALSLPCVTLALLGPLGGAPMQDPSPATTGAAPRAAYLDGAGLESALRAAVAKDPSRARLAAIGRSAGGRDIWCVTLSEGDDATKSALLVVAGADGTHLVGSEMALANVELLVERAGSDGDVQRLLRDHAIYVIPRLSPDGAEALLGAPSREHGGNLRPVDADRDRRLDEDGPDDLDGDGLVTSMRIPDPKGEWLVDAKDPRIVRRADRAKGERGTHRLEREGRDDDGDGAWNEDGPGGIDVFRNFAHGWREHESGVGTSAISEPESRAFADFLLAHGNVAAVVVYGLHDSVRKAPKTASGGTESEGSDEGTAGRGARARGGRGAPGAILKEDGALLERVSKLYREKTGLDGEVESPSDDGSLPAWTYFQRGLPTHAIRVWAPPSAPAKAKPSETPGAGAAEKPGEAPERKEGDGDAAAERPTGAREGGARRGPGAAEGRDPKEKDSKEKEDDAAKAERARLAWNDETLGGSAFVAWKLAADAALAEKGIEVGGWKPGALVNPPAKELAELARTHTDFLVALAAESFPNIVIASASLESQGGGLASLVVSIRNEGKAPASSAMARRTRTVRPIRVRLSVEGGAITVGRPQTLIRQLDPSDPPSELRWIVKGPAGARVLVEVDSPHSPVARFEGEIR